MRKGLGFTGLWHRRFFPTVRQTRMLIWPLIYYQCLCKRAPYASDLGSIERTELRRYTVKYLFHMILRPTFLSFLACLPALYNVFDNMAGWKWSPSQTLGECGQEVPSPALHVPSIMRTHKGPRPIVHAQRSIVLCNMQFRWSKFSRFINGRQI